MVLRRTTFIDIGADRRYFVVGVGLAQDKAIRSMRGNTCSARRLGGTILNLEGGWLIVQGVWA